MRRHFNYTGRTRITRDQATINILDEQVDGRPVFVLHLRLRRDSAYPDNALIRVEANRSNVVQRWDYGTYGNRIEPTLHERRLTEVESSSFFRVFVVEPESGKLLGLADKIRPIQPADSLVPLLEDDGTKLGREIWRVEFEGDEGPVLLVNNNVPNIGDITRSDKAFRSLVMPQVLRQVLRQIVFVNEDKPDDDEGGWSADWFNFVDGLGVTRPDLNWGEIESDPAQVEQAQEWIDEAVMAFAEKSVRALRSYREAVGG